MILSSSGTGPYITHLTPGKIVDAGIKDANNMGAAMAPAAYDTLKTHFDDTGFPPTYYDLIVTGDLGSVGHSIILDFFKSDGIDLSAIYQDCGLMIYSVDQDVHAGGSGLRLLCHGSHRIYIKRHEKRQMEKGSFCRNRGPYVPYLDDAGREHTRHLPRRYNID